MKVCFSFIVYNRISMLETALKSCIFLKESGHDVYINAVFSELDFLGNKSNQNIYYVWNELIRLHELGLINRVISTKKYTDLDKRNVGLEDCKINGINIYSSLDCDEVLPKNIDFALNRFVNKNVHISYAPLIGVNGNISYYIPLFCKITKDSLHVKYENSILQTNPVREVQTKGVENKIYVHDFMQITHYTDIEKNEKLW